jgi:hypothetical protein
MTESRQDRATGRWVRRTLARVAWLFQHVPAERLADMLVVQGAGHIEGLGAYLQDVQQVMDRLQPDQPQPCVVCGHDLRYATTATRCDVRYCSRACRQRAYRERVTGRQQEDTSTRHDADTSDTSRQLSATEPVTHEERDE